MKQYKSKLSEVIENTQMVGIESALIRNEIGNVFFNKISAGQYECTSNGLFSLDRTFVYIKDCDGTSDPSVGRFRAWVLDANTILITSMNDNADCVDVNFRHLDFIIENE